MSFLSSLFRPADNLAVVQKVENLNLNRAARVIQKAWRVYKARKKRIQDLAIKRSFCDCFLCYCRKLSLTLGKERLDYCASKIQAVWKGFIIRKRFLNDPSMSAWRMIYRRLIQVHCGSKNEMKLANRMSTAITKLMLNIKNDHYIVTELATLEVASKMSPKCCIKIAKDFSHNLISIINTSNRSEVHKSRIDHGIGVLLNIMKVRVL
jgi:PREDICTED: similar to abnormal spindle-like microcephaly-associated protein homolog